MIEITKPYLLVYSGTNAIMLSKSDKLPYSLGLPTDKEYIQVDTKEEIDSEITELGVVLTEEQKQEWSQIN